MSSELTLHEASAILADIESARVAMRVFPAVFWLWMAGFGGGTLILTGFYVRHFWR